MPLTPNVNSYVSASEADTYFQDRMGAEEWEALSTADKEKTLVSATDMLDSLCTWNGEKTTPTQPLEFPRDGDIEVPVDIKTSQINIALAMVIEGEYIYNVESQDLTGVKAGSVNLTLSESVNSNPFLNTTTKQKLRKYGTCMFGGSIQCVPLVR